MTGSMRAIGIRCTRTVDQYDSGIQNLHYGPSAMLNCLNNRDILQQNKLLIWYLVR